MKVGAVKVSCPVCEAEITAHLAPVNLVASGDVVEALVSIERMSGCPHADAWRPRPPDGGEPMPVAA